jgi:hypothetical protein
MHSAKYIKKLATETTKRVLWLGAWPVGFDVQNTSLVPTSGATFTTGEHYKLELVGPNNAATLYALLEMTAKAGIRPHRIVGFLGGLGSLSDAEIKDSVNMSKSEGFELVVAPISPATNIEGFAEGKQPCEGSLFGPHLRGAETVELYLEQLIRGVELGVRSLLVWDFAAFDGAQDLIERKKIPLDIAFKISIFGGASHAVDLENWMSRLRRPSNTSLNPVPLPVRGFGELRYVFPHEPALDVHMTTLDSMLGLDRIHEAHEIIRVASPVYAKIEQGVNVPAMCDERTVLRDVLPRVVASAQRFLTHMERYPEFRREPAEK